jgi:hypothetical protein
MYNEVTSLFLFPIAIELLEKCGEVAGLLLVFQACIIIFVPGTSA